MNETTKLYRTNKINNHRMTVLTTPQNKEYQKDSFSFSSPNDTTLNTNINKNADPHNNKTFSIDDLHSNFIYNPKYEANRNKRISDASIKEKESQSKSSSINTQYHDDNLTIYKGNINYYPNLSIPKQPKQTDTLSYNVDAELIATLSNEESKKSVETESRRIMLLLVDDYFEDGEITKAERYIGSRLNDNDPILLAALNKTYVDYIDNPHIIEGLIFTLSHFEYNKIAYIGPMMAFSLLHHENLGVKCAALKAFINWNSKKLIKCLETQEYSASWLKSYVKRIIDNLNFYGDD